MSFDIAMTYRAGPRVVTCTLASEAPVVAVVGPSGAGKTSLLNCIAGLARPRSGHIAIGGARLFDAASRVDLPPEHRRAGYVFQDLRLFPHLSVRGNLAYGSIGEAAGWPDLAEVADLLDLAPLLERRPRNLSGGEARRVAFGRAVLSRPAFLLLDEPLASLDPARAEATLAMIERIRRRVPLPTLLVTHDVREVERMGAEIFALG